MINYNGKIISSLSNSLPNALLLETMLWDNGIELWKYHSERLLHSAIFLKVQLPPINFLWEEILNTIEVSKVTTKAKVQLIISNNEEYCIVVQPLLSVVSEFTLCVEKDYIKQVNETSHLKYYQRKSLNIVTKNAQTNHCNDAILLNQYGRVAETSIANIFWIKDHITYTPPISEGCVSGVYRSYYLDNNSVVEKCTTLDDLLSADSIFLTNALRGVIVVNEIKL